MYILIYISLGSELEYKHFCTEWQQAFPDFNLLLTSSWVEFRFVTVVLPYLNRTNFSKDIISVFLCLRFCSAFWSRGMTLYLDFSAFTPKPVTALATSRASLFFFFQKSASTIKYLFNFYDQLFFGSHFPTTSVFWETFISCGCLPLLGNGALLTTLTTCPFHTDCR